MFRRGHLYSHPKMLDCNIYVLRSFRTPDGSYKLKIRWFNRRGLDLGVVENVVVKSGKTGEWYNA